MNQNFVMTNKESGNYVEPMTTRKAMITLGFPLSQTLEETTLEGAFSYSNRLEKFS